MTEDDAKLQDNDCLWNFKRRHAFAKPVTLTGDETELDLFQRLASHSFLTPHDQSKPLKLGKIVAAKLCFDNGHEAIWIQVEPEWASYYPFSHAQMIIAAGRNGSSDASMDDVQLCRGLAAPG